MKKECNPCLNIFSATLIQIEDCLICVLLSFVSVFIVDCGGDNELTGTAALVIKTTPEWKR